MKNNLYFQVVSEDELPTVKKEGTKRKLEENEYDPGSPTSESEQSAAKKPALEGSNDVKKEEKPAKKKLPELDKYWKAVNDDPTDFTGWTYLLQYVDQEVSNDVLLQYNICISGNQKSSCFTRNVIQ